ncbi:MAG: pseudouridine synthase [Candidatus Omnitrophota bacterium]|nr:rRNA pseudouridine synthase [Candidatus Omnitrophota bacterium]
MRLNAYISKSGYTSRRKADDLIKKGEVKINGEVLKDLSYQVKSGDKVSVNNQGISLQNQIYIMFNKPQGVTTTLKDEFASRLIMDCLPKKFKGIYPVGRLDKNSCGLIILTNDGEFCYELTHPKFEVEKEYLVRLKGELRAADCRRTEKGVMDEGDCLKVKRIRILNKGAGESVVKVIISEGKKRHLRRLFKNLGFMVIHLVRVRIGNLRLGDLAEGKYRAINPEEV